MDLIVWLFSFIKSYPFFFGEGDFDGEKDIDFDFEGDLILGFYFLM
jgi:hypothetical protein